MARKGRGPSGVHKQCARGLKFESLEERVVLSSGSLASSLDAVTPAAVSAIAPAAALLPEDWVHSLNYTQFNLLLPEHVTYLTTEQIASIPNVGYFASISDEARAELSPAQVQALQVDKTRIYYLTPVQRTWLTTAQIQSLQQIDFQFLTPSQSPLLTQAQIASIPDTGAFASWSAAARAALTQSQVQALNAGPVRITLLTAQQRTYLTASQIRSLDLYDFAYVPTSHVPYLTPAQIATIPDPGPFSDWTAESRAALTQTQVQALKVSAVRINKLTATQIGWLTTAQIQSLQYIDFPYLATGQIPLLTQAQIASIPDTGAFSSWSSGARAALTQSQVQALRTGPVRITLLTPQQRSYLTAAQVRALGLYDFAYLPTSHVPYLTPAQIATIPDPGPFSDWTAEARAALTQTQVQALKVSAVRINKLTATQIGWLTTAQIQSLKYNDFPYLTPTQVPLLTLVQIASVPDTGAFAAWSAEARAALSSIQVETLNIGPIRITLLTPQQRSYLTADQIRSLAYNDFAYVPPSHVPFFTPAQIASIPDPGPFSEWTTDARAALTRTQVQALNVGSVRINKLTATQIGWLTAAQVQSLQQGDFQYLTASQTPFLTVAQIRLIPDTGAFSFWTSSARAALGQAQVQALSIGPIRITLLTPQQRSYLTAEQIRSLDLYDFAYVPPSHVPFLTTAQIASIPDPGPFSEWTAEARAALTRTQVQALNVSSVRINKLTSTQIGWLSTAQIQALDFYDFANLSPFQVPFLTAAQIASIPDPGPFSEWTAEARAALTPVQVQALNVASVRIDKLTPTQIGWLKTGQLQSLPWTSIELLQARQIPILLPAQFVDIPSAYYIQSLSDEAQTKITRAQLLALKPEVFGAYTRSFIAPPANYVPTVDAPRDADGIADNPHAAAEEQHVIDLVPLSSATHIALASGNWTDPSIWLNGQVPTAGARVVIANGATVRFDASLAANKALSTLRIDGQLSFATNINTQLAVDTIVVTRSGAMHIGTESAPIASNVVARVLIPDGGPIDAAWDPYMISRGLISLGEVRMFGKEVTPFTALAVQPRKGDTQLTLTEIPVNWKVGDKIIVTGTHAYVPGAQTEERIIRAISGNVVTIDALLYDHLPPEGFGLSSYVANFNRNIAFASAVDDVPLERPHIMFMHNPNVQLENVSITGFGRTDKSIAINDPVVVNGVRQAGTGTNPRARYAIHFHHTGVNPLYDPAVVRGVVVDGSPGWGYVNHQSNVIMEDNIAYQVKGSSFVTEDGNEIGVMRGNLSVSAIGDYGHPESRKSIHDFGHSGNGFWLQGPGVAVEDNVSVGNTDAAFFFFTATSKAQFDAVNLDNPALAAGQKTIPVGMAPLAKFSGNVAIASKSGVEIWFHQNRLNDGETYLEDFTAWNLRNNGVETHYSGQITIRDSLVIGNVSKFDGTGLFVTHETHDVTIDNVRVIGFEIGIYAPSRRANVISNVTINAVRGIFIEGALDTLRSITLIGPIKFESATPEQLQYQSQYYIYLDGSVKFGSRSLESMLSLDRIRVANAGRYELDLYFPEQAADYVPFQRGVADGDVPEEYLGLTNAELKELYGVSLGGRLAASNASARSGFRALIEFTIRG